MSMKDTWLTDDVEKPMESPIKKLERSKNSIINRAARELLAKQSLEDSPWQDTLAAIESVKAGKSIDEADVNTWLNSWGTDSRMPPPK